MMLTFVVQRSMNRLITPVIGLSPHTNERHSKVAVRKMNLSENEPNAWTIVVTVARQMY